MYITFHNNFHNTIVTKFCAYLLTALYSSLHCLNYYLKAFRCFCCKTPPGQIFVPTMNSYAWFHFFWG
jgi:hypothetical protein